MPHHKKKAKYECYEHSLNIYEMKCKKSLKAVYYNENNAKLFVKDENEKIRKKKIQTKLYTYEKVKHVKRLKEEDIENPEPPIEP